MEFTWEFPTSTPATPAVTTVEEGTTDHVGEAVDRLPEQFRNDPNVNALLAALVGPAQALEAALQDMLLDRGVDTAVGVQLDIIGKLVGQPRNGLDDDVYRRYIRARIKTSRSNGTVEDLVRIVVMVISDLAAKVIVARHEKVTVVITMLNLPLALETAQVAILFLRLAVAAGVRVVFDSSASPPEETFRFDVGPGLDVGHLATRL